MWGLGLREEDQACQAGQLQQDLGAGLAQGHGGLRHLEMCVRV